MVRMKVEFQYKDDFGTYPGEAYFFAFLAQQASLPQGATGTTDIGIPGWVCIAIQPMGRPDDWDKIQRRQGDEKQGDHAPDMSAKAETTTT